MKPSPEELAQTIHRTLRSVPLHRAPRTLEGRVLAAIEARAALPWWRQSFAQWPMPARVAFLISSAAVAKLVLMATVWVMAGFDSAQFASAFSAPQAWIGTGSSIVQGISACAGTLYRSIPPLWLYGGLAFVGAMYAALFGLGATAYRTLYANR